MILKRLTRYFYIEAIFVISIFLLDRFSKLYVIYLDNQSYNSEIFLSKYLNINLIWNEGIAFGLFSFNQDNLYNILTILISIVVLIILYFIIKTDRLKKYALLMIFAGATGNLFDRIFYKAVPDFIDFHVGNFHWFIFNVSDIFITLGVLLMITLELIGYKKEVDEKI